MARGDPDGFSEEDIRRRPLVVPPPPPQGLGLVSRVIIP